MTLFKIMQKHLSNITSLSGRKTANSFPSVPVIFVDASTSTLRFRGRISEIPLIRALPQDLKAADSVAHKQKKKKKKRGKKAVKKGGKNEREGRAHSLIHGQRAKVY